MLEKNKTGGLSKGLLRGRTVRKTIFTNEFVRVVCLMVLISFLNEMLPVLGIWISADQWLKNEFRCVAASLRETLP